MKYEFHVGDYVEANNSVFGFISDVGDTSFTWICKTPIQDDIGTYDDVQITNLYKNVSKDFKRIGQYDFTKPEQLKKIERLPNDVAATFRIDGKICKIKNQVEANKWAELFYPVELISKINELVDAVNELKEECSRE